AWAYTGSRLCLRFATTHLWMIQQASAPYIDGQLATAANQAKENHHVVHVEHYKKAGENPSIAYAYADSSKRGEVGLAGYKTALNAWAFHSPHELVILARCHASCWLLVTTSPETSHFSLKQRRQADRTKSRRQDMFVKLRTQNAKGRDAHQPVSEPGHVQEQ
ncbi:hypothetical protein NOF04DRAFT_6203, partial [Fusarium oxysporum II5]